MSQDAAAAANVRRDADDDDDSARNDESSRDPIPATCKENTVVAMMAVESPPKKKKKEEAESKAQTAMEHRPHSPPLPASAHSPPASPASKKLPRISTAVVQLDLETDRVLRIYKSIRQVERETNLNRKTLRQALIPGPGGRAGTAGGFRWRLKRPGDEYDLEHDVKQGRKAKAAHAKDDSDDTSLPSPSEMAKVAAATTLDRRERKRRRSKMGQEDVTESDDEYMASDNDDDDDDQHEHDDKIDDDDNDEHSSSHGSSSSGETEDDEDEDTSPSNLLPAIDQGKLEFTLNGPLQSQLICELCMGYFREPYRITTCMHCFCKSCLLLALERAGHQCPSCQTYLGRLANSNEIPFKPDRLLHDLMDKVLFPELAAADDEAEADFYASLGISKKAEFREQSRDSSAERASTSVEKARLISFQIVPGAGNSALHRPFIETESSLTIAQLKKYLLQQEHKTVTDLYCLGTVLGNEWSIDFVLKTIWNRRHVSEQTLLSIEYH